jgi:hypothetical protein
MFHAREFIVGRNSVDQFVRRSDSHRAHSGVFRNEVARNRFLKNIAACDIQLDENSLKESAGEYFGGKEVFDVIGENDKYINIIIKFVDNHDIKLIIITYSNVLSNCIERELKALYGEQRGGRRGRKTRRTRRASRTRRANRR